MANGLGNLVSRIASLCDKSNFGGYQGTAVPDAPEGYHDSLSDCEFDRALGILWQTIVRLNRDIERTKPWELLKANNGKVLKCQLSAWLQDIRQVAYWLGPFLPQASDKILGIVSRQRIEACGSLFPRLR